MSIHVCDAFLMRMCGKMCF
uniref:Uncharacterized protein n=1 Tax=Anguilla anguilla TaxID=7936 RepID=A0A0E9TCX7_ANGAN